jgi:glutathione peroxidase
MSRLIAAFASLSLAFLLSGPALMAADKAPASLAFEMKTLDGKGLDLGQYAGKTVLVVNVASECGSTGQYEGLQALYEKYKDKGLVVLGVPCNQFAGQEPGTEGEIQTFCATNFGIDFPMTAKVDVKGKTATPLYQFLTRQETTPKGAGEVSWNFEKFLIGKDGSILGRYASAVEPEDEALVAAIEKDLAK